MADVSFKIKFDASGRKSVIDFLKYTETDINEGNLCVKTI